LILEKMGFNDETFISATKYIQFQNLYQNVKKIFELTNRYLNYYSME